MSSSAPLLQVRGLQVRYGEKLAVDDISLDVTAGKLIAIIGPNGAGKSTCFNAISGQRPPNAGEILLDGKNIVGLAPEAIFRRGVGRTFQVTATVPTMTVRENVQVALISYRRRSFSLLRSARLLYRDEAEQLLELIGMRAQADRACGVLAYGDLKRLELAIALANEPRLLLMDEPTAGMAPSERAELMALVAKLAADKGIGVLFTEHDIDIVFSLADRIVVMNRGQLLAAGTPDVIRADPKVREIYLGSDHADSEEGHSA
ncbi:branched-chain amino acid transport system ATP-binding protein [Nitrobacteraceae bacterium AZCC 2161]